jgi:hypothetical protein
VLVKLLEEISSVMNTENIEKQASKQLLEDKKAKSLGFSVFCNKAWKVS